VTGGRLFLLGQLAGCREKPLSTQKAHEYDLFVSYADADGAWVEGYLLDALHAAGVVYHSEEAFALGVPCVVELKRAIRASQRTSPILSPAYLVDELSQTGYG
jgi:hypothetical protein